MRFVCFVCEFMWDVCGKKGRPGRRRLWKVGGPMNSRVEFSFATRRMNALLREFTIFVFVRI